MVKVKIGMSTASLTSKQHQADLSWFQSVGSSVVGWLKAPLASAGRFIKNVASRIARGAGAVFDSIRKGKLGQLFQSVAKENPIAAGVAVLAVGVAIGGVIVVGGTAVSLLAGAVGTAIASLGVGGLAIAIPSLGFLVPKLFDAAEELYLFDLNIQINLEKQLEDAINPLYESMGRLVGTGVASFAVGATGNLQSTVNIALLARLIRLDPNSKEELISAARDFIQESLNAFGRILFAQAFVRGRNGIKALFKKAPQSFKTAFPRLFKIVEKWGAKDSKPFVIAEKVEEFVESIDNEKLKNFTQGFTSSFWRQYRSGIEYRYA